MIIVSRLEISSGHTNVFFRFAVIGHSDRSLVYDAFCKAVAIERAFIFAAAVTAIVILLLTFQQVSIVVGYCVLDVGHAGVTYFDSVTVEYFVEF